MDPASVFGAFSGGIQVVQAIVSTVHGLKQLYGKFKGADLTIQSLIWELSSTKLALEGLQEWSHTHYHGTKSDGFGQGLATALENCHAIMEVLSSDVTDLLQGTQSNEGMGLRIRMKAVWNEEMMRGHQEMLRGQVQALQLSLQLFQCQSATAQQQLLEQPTSRQIMSQVADDAETLRSVRGSRAGTDIESVSGSSMIHPALREKAFVFDQSVADSPAYRRVQQQRVVPQLSLQTHFESDTPRFSRSPLTDEGYHSSYNDGSSLTVPKFGGVQRPRGFSVPNNQSSPILPGHSRSISYNHSPSRPGAAVSRQWQSEQASPQKPRSPGERLSAFFSRSRVQLKALAQGSSPSSATSPTISRDKRSMSGDTSPSIDLTSMDAALVPLLVKAAQAGSRDEVERLIERSCDIDQCHFQSGRNALLVAAHCGHDAIVELLIRKNANLAALDASGATALHLAASRGHCAVIELLMIESALLEANNSAGETALRVAADCGQVDAVEVLLMYNAKVNTRADTRMTPLHSAAKRGDARITQLLISNGADIEAKDGLMMTALHYASEMGHVEVIKMLLDRRLQIDTPGPEKMTPLMCAAGAGQIQAVEFLLKRRAATRAVDEAGMTALHWAAYHGHEEIVKILSQKRSSLCSGNKSGQTPLHLATGRSQFGVVDFLLRKHVPINSQCSKGHTALHYACDIENDKDSVEIARMLLQAGADIEIFNTEDRQRPLHIAAARNSLDLIDMLCEQGAILDSRDSLDDRPICVASRHGQAEAVRKLLDRGSLLYARSEKHIEDSPLCLAAKGGHFIVVSHLLERGASTLRKDDFGWLPFHYAAYYGHLDVLQLLLSYGNIPDTEAPEILAMPDAIGFAPDADISEDQKFQVQSVLCQAFEHLGIVRGFTERPRPLLPTSQIPTAANIGTHPFYGHTTVNPYYSRGLHRQGAVHRNNIHRELPGWQSPMQQSPVTPIELPDFSTVPWEPQEEQDHQQLSPRAPSNMATGRYTRADAREVTQGHGSGNGPIADRIPHPPSEHDVVEESRVWPWPEIRIQQTEEPPDCATWPRLASPLQLPSFMEAESTTWRDHQIPSQTTGYNAESSTWSPLNTFNGGTASIESAISSNTGRTVSSMNDQVGGRSPNETRGNQLFGGIADTEINEEAKSATSFAQGPFYPLRTSSSEASEKKDARRKWRFSMPPGNNQFGPPIPPNTSVDQRSFSPITTQSPPNFSNAAVPLNPGNRFNVGNTASTSRSRIPRPLAPPQRKTSPLLAPIHRSLSSRSIDDPIVSRVSAFRVSNSNLPLNVRGGLRELEGAGFCHELECKI